MARSILLILVTLFFLASCSSVSVQKDFDPSFDFSALRTFAWQTAAQPQTGDPKVDNDLRDGRIRNAVVEVMRDKGLKEVDAAEADLLLAYYVSFERRLDSSSVSVGFGRGSYGRYGGAGLSSGVTEYEQGRLTIDIINPDDDKTIWRGEGTRVVSGKAKPQEMEKKIREAVQKILKEFPPRK